MPPRRVGYAVTHFVLFCVIKDSESKNKLPKILERTVENTPKLTVVSYGDDYVYTGRLK